MMRLKDICAVFILKETLFGELTNLFPQPGKIVKLVIFIAHFPALGAAR